MALLLPATVAFSLMRIVEAKSIGVQEPRGLLSNGKFSISIPFYINNTGFYDLKEVEVNLNVYRGNDRVLTLSAELPTVPAGEMVNSSCNASLILEELLSKHRALLTDDAELNVNASIHFRIASAIAFTVFTGFTMPWGAPFHKLAIYNITYDEVSRIFSAFVSFENHAFFQVNGSLLIKLYDSAGELIGSAVQNVNVPSNGAFQGSLKIRIDDLLKLTRGGVLRLYLLDTQIWEGAWELP
jgi:hypothetical protein